MNDDRVDTPGIDVPTKESVAQKALQEIEFLSGQWRYNIDLAYGGFLMGQILYWAKHARAENGGRCD